MPAGPDAGLDSLIDDIRRCRVCVDEPRHGGPLPHEPNPVFQVSNRARLCIAGQAPGTQAHQKSRPFDDPSGVRLRQWLDMSEDQFYDPTNLAIIPMGFCFPGLDAKGGDLPPRRECAPEWRQALFDRLPSIELVLVIGQYAQAWHLGDDRSRTLTETVRNWRALWDRPARPRVLPLPHPSWRNNAWLKKNPWFDAEVLPVLRREVKRLIR